MQTYIIAGRYYGTQADAKAAAKEHDIKFDPERDGRDVPTDKAGLIAYLNMVVQPAHREDEYTTVVERQDPPVAPNEQLARSLDLDDLFEAAPLGQQLTLASIAMENMFIHLQRTNTVPKAAQGYGGSKPRVVERRAVLVSTGNLNDWVDTQKRRTLNELRAEVTTLRAAAKDSYGQRRMARRILTLLDHKLAALGDVDARERLDRADSQSADILDEGLRA